MNKTRCILALSVSLLAAVCASGCSPVSLGISVAGSVVDDADVRDKSKAFMGASSATLDEALGRPVEVLRSESPQREWRLYPVKYDVLKSHRYVAEMADGRVIWFCKAQKSSEIVLDAATYAYFAEKCKGNTPQVCQRNIGHGPPALSMTNVDTGQLVQFYDARMVKDVQKPYYGVLRFGPGGTCTEVGVLKILASSDK